MFGTLGESLPKLRGTVRRRFRSADTPSSDNDLRGPVADNERGADEELDLTAGADSIRVSGGGDGGRYSGKTATDAGLICPGRLRDLLRTTPADSGLSAREDETPLSGGVGGVDVHDGGGIEVEASGWSRV